MEEPKTTNGGDVSQLSGGALAYLGDAVLEVFVRRMLIARGISHPGRLSQMALTYVRATAQSAGMEALLPLLTEEEEAVYRRGRNAAGAHPKSASVAEYRRATGMEALLGYLFAKGDTARLHALTDAYFADRDRANETEGAH